MAVPRPGQSDEGGCVAANTGLEEVVDASRLAVYASRLAVVDASDDAALPDPGGRLGYTEDVEIVYVQDLEARQPDLEELRERRGRAVQCRAAGQHGQSAQALDLSELARQGPSSQGQMGVLDGQGAQAVVGAQKPSQARVEAGARA